MSTVRAKREDNGNTPLAIFDTANKECVPKRIHLRAAGVHDLRKVFMDLPRAKIVPVVRRKLVDNKLIQHALDILEVGHVSTCAEHGIVSDRVQTLHILETSKGAI